MTYTAPGQQTNALLADANRPAFPTTSQETVMSSYSPTFAPQVPLAPAVDPARTLGIVGLVLSIFASAIGLVISIVAYRTSRRAGFRNGAALAGIVIGGLATAAVITAAVVGGVAAKSLVDTCHDLGPGQHVVHGVTYTCG